MVRGPGELVTEEERVIKSIEDILKEIQELPGAKIKKYFHLFGEKTEPEYEKAPKKFSKKICEEVVQPYIKEKQRYESLKDALLSHFTNEELNSYLKRKETLDEKDDKECLSG